MSSSLLFMLRVAVLLLCVVLPTFAQTRNKSAQTAAPAPAETESEAEPTIAPRGELPQPSTANKNPIEKPLPDNRTGTAGPLLALPPEKERPVRITRFESAPTIDGRLDEDVWQSAATLKDFYQIRPGDNTQPSRPTEVRIGYDTKNFYIGFHAFDEPSQVTTLVPPRDSVSGGDHVTIYLDTFNDRRRAYALYFSPTGVQGDGILTEGAGFNRNVDIVMESQGTLTEDGYTIEVRVPFVSLRYEAGKGKQWGVHVTRNIQRLNDERTSWMPISRDNSSFLPQAGRITGIEDIDTERTVEIIPTLTLSETGRRVRSYDLPMPVSPTAPLNFDPGRLVNEPLAFDPGVTGRIGITPNVTFDFTINPDFAQVEADQTIVTANQRFPVFFPERRPFFLEGIDIFETRLNVVNTRAIVDPDYAAKLTGKRGRNTFGLLLASDAAPGNYSEDERTELSQCQARRLLDPTVVCNVERFIDKNAYIGVLRLKRDVGRASNVGLFATSYNFIERHNDLGGFDGRFRLNPTTEFDFQVVGTTSRRFFRDPDLGRNTYRTGNGFGYAYAYDVTGRTFGYILSGSGRTRDYRTDVGFTARTNTNQHRAGFRWSTEPDAKRFVISRRITNNSVIGFDWQGRSQYWQNESQATFNLQRQTSIGGGYEFGYERLLEEEFGSRRSASRRGAFFGADPERSTYNRTYYGFIEARPTVKYGAEVVVIYTQNAFDFDFGAGPRFPRVSPAALRSSGYPLVPRSAVPLDPGPGRSLRIETDLNYRPTPNLRLSLDYTKSRLVRNDTNRLAFDDNIFSFSGRYLLSRFTFLRARLDYTTLGSRVRAQYLFAYEPNPGTSLYAGYNDDLNRNGFSPFVPDDVLPVIEPGFRRNGRTFFIKLSYLIRRSI